MNLIRPNYASQQRELVSKRFERLHIDDERLAHIAQISSFCFSVVSFKSYLQTKYKYSQKMDLVKTKHHIC